MRQWRMTVVRLIHSEKVLSEYLERDDGRPGEDLTEQEIMSMVNEGHENGVLQESEAEMINNIFTLDQKEAKDIMTHRKQIMH